MAKVNFFSTIVGIWTRIIQLNVALLPVLNFIFWLHLRDLYYSVGGPYSCLPTAET